MLEGPPYLFEVETPLGFTVRTTQSYWELIGKKHPEMADRLEEVQACLRSPALIRRSKKDVDVYLFYAQHGSYHTCVVAKRTANSAFVVTCYVTDKAKEGVAIWPTSG